MWCWILFSFRTWESWWVTKKKLCFCFSCGFVICLILERLQFAVHKSMLCSIFTWNIFIKTAAMLRASTFYSDTACWQIRLQKMNFFLVISWHNFMGCLLLLFFFFFNFYNFSFVCSDSACVEQNTKAFGEFFLSSVRGNLSTNYVFCSIQYIYSIPVHWKFNKLPVSFFGGPGSPG